MKYTYDEVIDIIRSTTDRDPHEILSIWDNKKANTPLSLSEINLTKPFFVYTFPITVEGREVGEITLVDLYSNPSSMDDLMLKYFGKEDYDKSYWTYSHNSYLYCYLTIHKEFELPEICRGLRGDTLQSVDASGRPFEFRIAYGHPQDEGDEPHYYKWINGGYRHDNGVTVTVNRMDGWSLGKKINQNVERRLRDLNRRYCKNIDL